MKAKAEEMWLLTDPAVAQQYKQGMEVCVKMDAHEVILGDGGDRWTVQRVVPSGLLVLTTGRHRRQGGRA